MTPSIDDLMRTLGMTPKNPEQEKLDELLRKIKEVNEKIKGI